MSRCGKTHLLEAAVRGEVPDGPLREHAAGCARCRHELNWLETEQQLFRSRAARDEVQVLWRGVAARVETPRRGAFTRALFATAAAMVFVLAAGQVLRGGQSASGADASIAPVGSFEDWVTENAFSPERSDLCSRAEQGIGFHCGYVPQSALASR